MGLFEQSEAEMLYSTLIAKFEKFCIFTGGDYDAVFIGIVLMWDFD